MDGFRISAIQQVGVGTADFKKSWDWYIRTFGFDVKILEDDTVAERMLPYTGGVPQKRHACIAVNLQGGGGLEIWQYSERKPQPAQFGISPGDIGVFAAKIKCRDIGGFHSRMTRLGCRCSRITKDPAGKYTFFLADPFGNCFQLVGSGDVYIEDHKPCGGVAGAFVGVRNMDRSLEFYREVLGYDKILYDVIGTFADWSVMPGSGERYRRVLLGRSEAPAGPFSGLLGTNVLELVQALDRQPARIYEGRFWGDPGFIQICYDVSGMKELGRHCASKGHPFTVDSCPNGEKFDMGEASGHFTYVEDPDGTLIEFVETHRIPLAAKFGLYINLDGRRASRKLPRFLFRIMGLASRRH